MEALQALTSQLHFSVSLSQMIISFGILALGAIWGRMKMGALLSIGTFSYWVFTANKAVLFQIAVSNIYGIVTTVVVGMIMGFFLFYTWVSPSSSR